MPIQPISDLLLNKTASEKSDIKCTEIAKLDIKGKVKDKIKPEIELEIVGPITKIDINGQIGVELFARGWKNGSQLGFGKDGTIDIERFRIFNPPILVQDPLGTIIKNRANSNTGEIVTHIYSEDTREALLQSLTHTILQVGKDGVNIIAGKRGNTTSTFYPDASTISAACYKDDSNVWATTRDATASRVVYANTSVYASIGNGNGAGFYNILRAFILFDTASIPDADPINSATYSGWVSSVGEVSGTHTNIYVVSSTPASNTSIVVEDYDQLGSVDYGSASGFTAGQYKDFALNASGIAAISKIGITKFGLRAHGDFNNLTPDDTNELEVEMFNADAVGTANDPKLVVEHGSSTNSNFFQFM